MTRRSREVLPAAWIVRALARLLPRSFRGRHEADLLECHEDRWNDLATGAPGWAKARLWLEIATSILRLAIETRLPGRGRWEARRRGERGGVGTESIARELRFAGRRLLRRPMFALIVMGTLGLGLGANTAVFAVLHSVLIAPLPFEHPEELVRIYGSRRDQPGLSDRMYLAAPAVLELRREVPSLAGVAILQNYTPEGVDLTGGERPERLRLLRVGAGYFEALGVRPIRGRTLEEADERGERRVAVVREGVWRRHGGTAEETGRSMVLDGEAVTVVGVVPDGARDPLEGLVDVWMPSDLADRAELWDDNFLSVVARLARGADRRTLRAELDVLESRHDGISEAAAERGYAVVPLLTDVVGEVRPLLWALMGAVALLLLLTCVNVASLLVAGAAARERELAIRMSLGSSRAGLIRHFVVESALLAAGGAIVGLVVGMGALELMMSAAPDGLPRQEGVGLGPEAVALAALAALILGPLLGIVTALPFVRTSADRPRATGGAPGAAARRGRLRGALVAAEVALTVVLLSGAGVLLETLHRLNTRDLGADLDDVITFAVGLPSARYGTQEAIVRFNEELHRRVEAIRGVVAAGGTSRLPVTGTYNTWGTRRAVTVGEPWDVDNIQVNQRWIGGRFFEAAGLALLSGRLFTAEDGSDGPLSVVVNETLVEQLFPGEDPLGAYIRMGGRYPRIIGVVEDEALTPRGPAAPIAYHHQRQWMGGNREVTQLVRTTGEPAAIVPAVREALAQVDPDLVLHDPRTLRSVVGQGIGEERFAAMILAAFAALATIVAGLGLYGVLAQHVRGSRHEIGVRLALGARRGGVVALVVRRALALTLLGALVGVPAALALGRGLETFLFEVGPGDPLVLGIAVGLIVTVALASSTLPSLQAIRVDPARAFRED